MVYSIYMEILSVSGQILSNGAQILSVNGGILSNAHEILSKP